MSRLQAIERKLGLHRQPEKIPAPTTSGLGAAIEQLIADQVAQQVSEALDNHRERPSSRALRQVLPDKRPEFTDFKQVPEPPKTKAPVAREAQLQRDERGRVNVINFGDNVYHVRRDSLNRIHKIESNSLQLSVQRGADGKIVSIVPADIAPPTPAVPPAPLNR